MDLILSLDYNLHGAFQVGGVQAWGRWQSQAWPVILAYASRAFCFGLSTGPLGAVTVTPCEWETEFIGPTTKGTQLLRQWGRWEPAGWLNVCYIWAPLVLPTPGWSLHL